MPRAKKAAYPEFWISARIQFSSMPAELRCPNIPSNKMSIHLQISLSDAMFILKSDALKGAKILHVTRIVSHVETMPVAGAIPGRSKRRHPRPSRERAPRSTTAKKLFRKSCPLWEHPFPPSQVIFFGMVPSNHIYFEKKINSWDVSPFTTCSLDFQLFTRLQSGDSWMYPHQRTSMGLSEIHI